MNKILYYWEDLQPGSVRELDGEPETITFALPKELRLTGGVSATL